MARKTANPPPGSRGTSPRRPAAKTNPAPPRPTKDESSAAQVAASFRSLAEQTLDGVLRVGTGFRYLYANPAVARLLGKAPGEIVGRTVREVVDSEPLAGRWEERFKRVFDTGRETDVVEAFPTADGERTFQTRLVPEPDAKGRVSSVLAVSRDITDQTHAAERLRATELRSLLILDAVAAGTWEWELDTNQNAWSDRLWDLYGIPRRSGDPSYALWKSTIHPDDLPAVERVVSDAASQGVPFTVDWRVRASTGPTRWLMAKGTPVLDDHGRVTRMVGVVTDVTARKRDEDRRAAEATAQARAAGDERLRTVMAASRDGFWDRDLVTGRVFHSARMNEIAGLEPADSVEGSEAWRRRIHPDDLARIAPLYDSAVAGRESRFDAEYRIRLPDGTWRWVRARGGVAERDGSGRPLRLAGVVTDIHEWKTAEEALRSREAYLRSLTKQVPVGIFDTGPQGGLLGANDEFYRILGATPESVKGMGWLGLMRREDAERVRTFVRENSAHGAPVDGELELVRPDGRAVIAKTRAAPLRDAEGALTGYVGMLLDVTDLRLAERELKESESRFRALFENAPDPMFITLADGRILAANPAAEAAFGMSEAEIREAGREGIVASKEALPAIIEHRARYGSVRADLTFRRADGSTFVGEVTSAIYADGPQGRQAVILMRDVTARRHAEQVLRSIYASPVIGIAVGDLSGALLDLNDRLCELLGCSRRELRRTSWVELVHPDEREQDDRDLRRMIAGRIEHATRHKRFLRRDGSVVWGLASMACIRDPDGAIRQVILTVQDVDAAKKTEEALAASEERLRAVLAASTDGYFEWDLVADRVFRSARLNEIAGLDPADATLDRASWMELIHPDDLPSVGRVIEAMLAGEAERTDVDYRIRVGDGGWRWLRSRGRVTERDASGRALRAAGAITDVQVLKDAETKLRASEERLRTYFESPIVAIGIAAPEGRWLEVNDAFCRLMGYTREELLARPWSELTHPDDLAASQAEYQRILAGHAPAEAREKRYVRKDGSVVWASLSVSVGRDADGKVRNFVALLTDITARKLAEMDLRAKEADLRAVFESPAAGIAIAAPGKHFLLTNRCFRELVGYSEEELRDKTWWDLMHPDDLETYREDARRIIAGEANGFVRESRYRRKDGSTVWLRVSLSVYRGAGGALERAVAIVTDAGPQRAAQAQMQVASRLAALGTLVAGVAHEVNNPLAGAMASGVLAAEELRELRGEVRRGGVLDGEKVAGEIDEILENLGDTEAGLRRISGIVKDLTAFGRTDQRKTVVRLRDVVDQAMRWLPGSHAAAADFRVEDRGAPEVRASAGQLSQVVINLVTNAAQSLPADRRGRVTVRMGPGGAGMARLEVEDDGKGMTPEEMSRAFDPFFTTRRVGQGMGLGLAVAHAIVTEHGGTLTAASEVGKGTTFTVELPAAAPQA